MDCSSSRRKSVILGPTSFLFASYVEVEAGKGCKSAHGARRNVLADMWVRFLEQLVTVIARMKLLLFFNF